MHIHGMLQTVLDLSAACLLVCLAAKKSMCVASSVKHLVLYMLTHAVHVTDCTLLVQCSYTSHSFECPFLSPSWSL